MVRWPGHIPAGTVLNEHRLSHNDWFADAPRGRRVYPTSTEQLLEGCRDSAARPTRCTSTGYNQLPYLTGETDESPRKHFFYVSDDGDLTSPSGSTTGNWSSSSSGAARTLRVWAEPFSAAARAQDLQPAH